MTIDRIFNHTDRVKIHKRDVEISVVQPPDPSPASFTLERLELETYAFPRDALIQIEAYKYAAIQRWQWGTVGEPISPPKSERVLRDVPSPPTFRVSVVAGDGSGKLLGRADRLRASARQGREDLLDVLPDTEMGEEVWRVDFAPEPVLHINASIPSIEQRVANDVAFRSLVLPEVLRIILLRALIEERTSLDADEDNEWSNWLTFAGTHHSVPPPELPVEPSAVDLQQVHEWVNAVTRAFAAQPRLRAATRFSTIRRSES